MNERNVGLVSITLSESKTKEVKKKYDREKYYFFPLVIKLQKQIKIVSCKTELQNATIENLIFL